VLERALIFCNGTTIESADLDLRSAPQVAAPITASTTTGATNGATKGLRSLDSIEREAIKAALLQFHGNRTRAAEQLGVSRKTILNKIKAYGL
jgi:two-component system response regulator AtoC